MILRQFTDEYGSYWFAMYTPGTEIYGPGRVETGNSEESHTNGNGDLGTYESFKLTMEYN